MPWPLFLAPHGPSFSSVAVPTWACFILDMLASVRLLPLDAEPTPSTQSHAG